MPLALGMEKFHNLILEVVKERSLDIHFSAVTISNFQLISSIVAYDLVSNLPVIQILSPGVLALTNCRSSKSKCHLAPFIQSSASITE